ncbi:MAG: cation transporter [Lachnospiraceae bacterium]|jgi:cation diffusion facilitator family transporter|nr:cation transporter [Lachnospiraceae bacterium]
MANKISENSTTLNRDKVIIRTSIIGIVANIFLVAFKATVGLLANSIAVILDAVNNLSDALSSVITIVGTKLATKKPDKKHPLGYGRIEYLSAMIVAAIVLYAGITSAVESVKKIIWPEVADYSTVSLIIIAGAVVVKLILGRYVKVMGQKVNSGSLIASGSDALFDAVLSASVLASAVVFLTTGISLEAYVGVLISVFIIKAGIEMLMETLDEILGKRLERDYIRAIKKTICEDEYVSGAYDLILHSYGPDKLIGSAHVEVPDTLTADELDVMQRRIAENVYRKHGIFMVGIGIYSMNTKDDEIKAMRSDINHRILAHEGVLQIHGFYVNRERMIISLDVILDFELTDREQTYKEIYADISAAYPDYTISMNLDIDI